MARILIAEDDSSMRRFLGMALERAGHEVKICEDGLAALNALEEALAQDESYDLLLADIIMPGLDGIELSQKAAALRPDMKVMFITGFAAVALGREDSKADSETETQAPQILSKPFHLKDLVNQVDQILAA